MTKLSTYFSGEAMAYSDAVAGRMCGQRCATSGVPPSPAPVSPCPVV